MTGPLNLAIRVCLFPGMQDKEGHWQTAISLSEALASETVTLHFDKMAGHRFSSPEQLAAICQSVRAMRAQIKAEPENKA